MNKYVTVVVTFVLASILAFVYRLTMPLPENKIVPEVEPDYEFALLVEEVLNQKLGLLQGLAAEERLVDILRLNRVENATLTSDEISTIDSKWESAALGDPFVTQFLTNELAQILLQFKNDNVVFTEVFVTDAKGLNVGQTNKTTDYYQADEAWWQEAYNDGKGKSYHGEVEYDTSSQSRAVSLYVAVYDSISGETIGIIKAVGNLEIIETEL